VKADQSRIGSITLAMLLFSVVSCLSLMRFCGCNICCRSIRKHSEQSPGPGVQHVRELLTNTNWQSYVGESTMSYLSQMVALVIHNFGSRPWDCPGGGAGARIARHSTKTLGNFWVTWCGRLTTCRFPCV
jgi:K+-transporting ATPase ATPase A chain